MWEGLTWAKLEKRIREALRHPDCSVPSEIYCPAVMDLAKQVIGKIGESAIQRPGAVVSDSERLSFDQRLAVLRIIEAIIAEYEDWKKASSLERAIPALMPHFKSLEE